LVLVSWLDISSFLGGFSIGPFTAIITVVIGSIFAALTSHYRPQFIFATGVSFLLMLALRGWFLPAYYALPVLLAIGLFYTFVFLIRNRSLYRSKQFAGFSCALALLNFSSIMLSVLFDFYIVLPIIATSLAVVFGVASAVIPKHYRGYVIFVTLAAIIWGANLYSYITTGT
jgi:hypothetical protein